MDGVVLKDTSVTWRCPAHGNTRINLGPMDPGAKSRKRATWLGNGRTRRTLATPFGIRRCGTTPSTCTCPDHDIEVSVSGDQLTIVSAGYVPMAWVGCDVPGRFSDNGMPLEPQVPVHITFNPEGDQAGPRTFRVRGPGQ